MRTFLSLFFLFSVSQLRAQVDAVSRGNQYYRNGQYDQAEQQYRLAVQQNPSNYTAQYNLANALHRQKKYDEAQKILEALASMTADKKKKAAAAYNVGVGYTKQKSLEESIEAYKNALRADPTDTQARENLQKALRELKKQQSQSQQQKNKSNMSQKEAEQKLKQLQDKERELQQRLQDRNRQGGGKQSKDW